MSPGVYLFAGEGGVSRELSTLIDGGLAHSPF
jgi:hypothetical protein